MDVEKLVTVVPNDPKALAAVSTPFVTFEHPFKDRYSRFERQLEGMGRYNVGILFGDTWPDSYHDKMNWGEFHDVTGSYWKPQKKWSRAIWPETALYVTGVAKLLGVNPTVKYRPQMWTFCRFYEKCRVNQEDVDLLNEGTIYVQDRNIYPLTYPKLQLQPDQRELTIFWYGKKPCSDLYQLPKDTEVLHSQEEPNGNNFNRLVEQASGKYIAIHRDGDMSVSERFKIQLGAAADLVLCPVAGGGAPWLIRGYTQTVDTPSEQLSSMMIRRSALASTGGAHPEMTAGFDYDLFVRMSVDPTISIAHLSETLIARDLKCPYGHVYTQQVYNDAANRVRYTKDYHALSVRRRSLA